jgi:hypothetical protein
MNWFLPALALLFIGLKLAGAIAWSWWWVTLPLWGGLALVVVTATLAFLYYGTKTNNGKWG